MRVCLNKKLGIGACLFLVVISTVKGAPNTPNLKSQVQLSRIAFQSKKGNLDPPFSCQEKLTATVDLVVGHATKSDLRGEWYRPSGQLQETYSQSIETKYSNQPLSVYFWIDFGVKPRKWGEEFVLGGDYGSAQNPFHGSWTFAVFLDGKKMTSQSVDVVCTEGE